MAGQSQQAPQAAKKRGVKPSYVVLIIALILMIIAIIQNSAHAPVKFLWLDGTIWVWLLIALSVLLGAVIGAGVNTVFRRRKRKDD